MNRFWAVSLHSNFFAQGVAWLSHVKRCKLRPLVADVGLSDEHVKQLVSAEAVVLPTGPKMHLDLWLDILEAQPNFSVLLYSSPTDLFDPAETVLNGEDHMVFSRWPTESEYYNLCSPISSIVSRAKTANYIEAKVAEKQNGIASPARVCGPAYFWRAMMGMARLVRASQSRPSDGWEAMAANLFAASYPEYTLIEN